MKVIVKKGKAIVQTFNGYSTVIAVYVGANDDFFNQQYDMIKKTNTGAIEFEAVEVDVIEND